MATPSPEEIDAFTRMTDGSQDSRIALVLAVEIPIVVTMVAVLCLRFYARAKILARDDWIMAASGVFATVQTMLSCVSTRYGMGVHAWNLHEGFITRVAKLAWWYTVLFTPTTTLSKVSIVLAYMKIFPTRTDRIFCYAMLVFLALCGISITIALVFQCIPVNSYWDISITENKCYSERVASMVVSSFNSLSDLAVFLWPAPTLWQISLPLKQRIGLLFVFCIGCLVCVTGIVRIYYYTMFFKSIDIFWTGSIIQILGALEYNLAIICGCLPEIRPLFTCNFQRPGTAVPPRSAPYYSKQKSTQGPMSSSQRTYHWSQTKNPLDSNEAVLLRELESAKRPRGSVHSEDGSVGVSVNGETWCKGGE
ncbi:hypothetical protein EJ06DRAFT_306901 [Trichodelitschia bisporula]|uniref:Rhodopsin domain-containing protein n=1 Tax=Trichodelitschia bisporula TaxID=703511 RepID=A0A6G1I3T8_9PEZI|nr:hypothetical protein EJ06DRAFT_306901 [Trichodelitschia bisporula]